MIATATAEVSTGRKKIVRNTGRMRRCTDSISAASGNVISKLSGTTSTVNRAVTLSPLRKSPTSLGAVSEKSNIWR